VCRKNSFLFLPNVCKRNKVADARENIGNVIVFIQKVGDVESGKKRRKAEGTENQDATHIKKSENPKEECIQTFT
jgi:hypothetical protein